ncbi:hypothetical protein NDU88_006901, partial [Pleurodeles waltl]
GGHSSLFSLIFPQSYHQKWGFVHGAGISTSWGALGHCNPRLEPLRLTTRCYSSCRG